MITASLWPLWLTIFIHLKTGIEKYENAKNDLASGKLAENSEARARPRLRWSDELATEHTEGTEDIMISFLCALCALCG
jgi:hypothetical protein